MEGKFCYKEHKSGLDVTLAVCDSELSGKVLKLNDTDFEVSIEFYGDEVTDAEHVTQLIERTKIINAVGKETVKLLAKEGLVNEENALVIDGVPHVQIINF